jgi:hypothetical protein
MTRSDVLRTGGRLTVAVACAGAAAIGGCASAHHPTPMAARPTTQPALVVATTTTRPVTVAVATVPPAMVGWEHVRVESIDGRAGPFNAHAFGGVALAAGRHTLLVHLQADWAPFHEAVSDPDVEVTFTAEAGHSYRLDGWPTTVRDTTDHHADGRSYAVDQSSRYTTWEE